jgi:prophage regulatory protein
MKIKASSRAQRRLIRVRQVLEKTGDSKSNWYLAVKEGRAPKPVKIGIRCVAWVEDEIDDLVEQRIAARDAGGES